MKLSVIAAVAHGGVIGRANALPCMPAAVWRASGRRPGDGYYAIAHPRARTEEARVAAWEREHAAVLSAMPRYPVALHRPERGR